jgi:homoserine acetyltransferase
MAQTAIRDAFFDHHRPYWRSTPRTPALVNPLGIERFGALSGDSWGAGGMLAAMDWVVKGNNAVRKRVVELANSSEPEHVRDQTGLMLVRQHVPWRSGQHRQTTPTRQVLRLRVGLR